MKYGDCKYQAAIDLARHHQASCAEANRSMDYCPEALLAAQAKIDEQQREIERLESVAENDERAYEMRISTLEAQLAGTVETLQSITKKVPEKVSVYEAADMAIEFKLVATKALSALDSAKAGG